MSKYFMYYDELPKEKFGVITSAFGHKVRGDQIVVSMAQKEPGTGSKLHTHKVEQFNFVVSGEMKAVVNDEEQSVKSGGLIHIPIGTPHSFIAIGDEPTVFLNIKHKAEDMKGYPEDGVYDGHVTVELED
jgi:quercetin dioxygenase-like cupin family protein